MGKKCFVIMPFSENFNSVYKKLKSICHEFDIDCKRSDETAIGSITKGIFTQIYEADIIIADLSSSNPNVYYETAISHCIGLKTILITQENEIPFDIGHEYVIKYSNTVDGSMTLEKELKRIIYLILEGGIIENPAQMFLPISREEDKNKLFRKEWIDFQKNAWNKIQPLIKDYPNEHSSQKDALLNLLNKSQRLSKQTIPTIRLWGSHKSLREECVLPFKNIAGTVGECCYRKNFPIVGERASEDTFEYYAMLQIVEIMNTEQTSKVTGRDYHIFNHYEPTDPPNISGKLISKSKYGKIPEQLKLHNVEYPYYNRTLAQHLKRSSSNSHDSRIGSLLQSNIIILLGGDQSMLEMLEILHYIRENTFRHSSLPPIVIPLPWAEGRAQKIFNEYDDSLRFEL